MQLADIRTFLEYDRWATGRILDRAEQLTPEQFTAAPGPDAPSIGQVLTHMLAALQLLRERCEPERSTPGARPADIPTVADYRAAWERERRALHDYLDTLDERALEQEIRAQGPGGTFVTVRWHFLFQMIMHDAQHRAEIAERLTALGHSPGNLDFLVYVRGL